jgi:type IV secretory pathway TraG/TraD family ATPase VirD4
MVPASFDQSCDGDPRAEERLLARWLALSEAHGHGLFIGLGPECAVFAPPQHGALVLGPPRCGKTASIMVPNVLKNCGPVVAASTKPDLLHLTAPARSRLGDCLLYDPSGAVAVPAGVRRVAWSPLLSAASWSGALSVAESMVLAARPGSNRGDAAHWSERAAALLAVAFHAGALGTTGFAGVLEAIDRRQADDFRNLLARHEANAALSLLAGITGTDAREQSGIWSTAAGVLAGYRTQAAIDSTEGTALDSAEFVAETSTLYICAGSDEQRHLAPLVAGVLRDLRRSAYHRAAELSPGATHVGPPLLLALDEVANIAPLHDLPTVVAEGGSQGVVTLACLQDLSQAGARWGREADGFLSLFQAKVVFPGIGDVRTLETISKLGGEIDIRHTSETRSSPWAGLLGQGGHNSKTTSTRRDRRFPVEVIAQGNAGVILHLDGVRPQWLRSTPWFSNPELAAMVDPRRTAGPEQVLSHDAGHSGLRPPSRLWERLR